MIRALLIVFSIFMLFTFASSAEARPRHHRGVHHHAAQAHHASPNRLRVRAVRHGDTHHAHHTKRHVASVADDQSSWSGSSFVAGFSSRSSLVSQARSHLGQNARQVGVRTTLWCSAFIRKLSPASAGVDDRAISWLRRPHVTASVGAVAVLGRNHVGVVSGFTPEGNPIVISGNHQNRVAESVYPRSFVLAYVSAE